MRGMVVFEHGVGMKLAGGKTRVLVGQMKEVMCANELYAMVAC